MLLTDYLLRCYLIGVSSGIIDERASPQFGRKIYLLSRCFKAILTAPLTSRCISILHSLHV